MSLPCYYEDHAHFCPRCDSRLVRIKRRARDRLKSALFRTVHRFRCQGLLGCRWEGNLTISASRVDERRAKPDFYQ